MTSEYELQIRYLKTLIDKLRKLQTASKSLFDELERQLAADFREVQNTARTVDTVAFVATIVKSLVGLSRRALNTVGKTGKELALENKRFLSEFSQYQGTKSSGIIGLATETENAYIQYLLNFDSPSYWTRSFYRCRSMEGIRQNPRTIAARETKSPRKCRQKDSRYSIHAPFGGGARGRPDSVGVSRTGVNRCFS